MAYSQQEYKELVALVDSYEDKYGKRDDIYRVVVKLTGKNGDVREHEFDTVSDACNLARSLLRHASEFDTLGFTMYELAPVREIEIDTTFSFGDI